MPDDQRDANAVASYDYRAFGYRPRCHTMQSFALDNGMEFTAETPDPDWPGLIFSAGTERRAEQRIHGENPGDGRGFDVGSMVYRIDGEPGLPLARWSYLRVALREPVPHLLLEPVEGNVELVGFDEERLPGEFVRDERVEHPLDDVFVLYASPSDSAAALAVLTPELMGLLVHDAEPFTVEIRGRDMVVFGPVGAGAGSARSELPELRMRRFFGILQQVGVVAGVPGANDPSHPDADAAFYDQDVVDPQTSRFSSRVISLGIVGAVGLLLGAINLVWPDSVGGFLTGLQGIE